MVRSRSASVGLGLGVVAGLGSLLVSLAGCSSGDAVPRVAPSSPVSVSVGGSPGEDRGPVATVRAWVEAQNAAMRTGDTTRLRSLSADPCQACEDFIEPIEKVYGRGGRFETTGWSVRGAKVRPGSHDPVVVDVGMIIAGGKTIRRAGQAPVVYQAERHIMVFKIARQGGRNTVSFIGFLS